MLARHWKAPQEKSGQRKVDISQQARVGVRMPLLKSSSSDTHRVDTSKGIILDKRCRCQISPSIILGIRSYLAGSSGLPPNRHSPETPSIRGGVSLDVFADRQCHSNRSARISFTRHQCYSGQNPESNPPVIIYSSHQKFTLSSR